MADRGGNSFEIADWAFTGVKIENLAQRHVQRTNSTADRRGKRTLDGHAEVSDGFDGVIGQPFLVGVEGFFAGKDFIPGDFAFAAIGMFDRRVKNTARSFPDVAAGAVTLDERNDGVVRDLQLTATVVDRRSFLRNCLPVV